MKKFKSTLILTLLAFSLVGCGMTTTMEDTAENVKDDVENTVDPDRNDVEDNDANGNTAMDNTVNNATENTGNNSDDGSVESLDTLKKAVNEAVTKVNEVKASGTTEEDRTRFFELKQELDKLDDRLEALEDDIENKHKNENLSFEEYRSQEREIEKLEDELDHAEDRLESAYGFND